MSSTSILRQVSRLAGRAWVAGYGQTPAGHAIVLGSSRFSTSTGASNQGASNTGASNQGASNGASNGDIRTDWTREEVKSIYEMPFLELIHRAAGMHRAHNDPSMVQRCTLLSIKTGGCPENCNYCSQSSHWSKETGTKAEKLMDLDDVYEAAVRAKEAGSTRFCMGAAWRGPSQVGKGQWQRVLDAVTKIRALDMEVCTTLGMLTPEQAKELREAVRGCLCRRVIRGVFE
jgi:biotin synthase-like enzyme